MNSSDIIAKRLYEAGVREAYGIPGGEVLSLIKGINDAGIRFVLCKQENAGGFMAEGAHHAGGAPGVLVATLGPGVANAVNVMANALQDRVPMIFLTGCVDPVEAATYTHQVFDHTLLLSSVTKASLSIVDGAVDVIVDKAISIATEDPPGPVHLDVPISVADSEQPAAAPVRRAKIQRGAPADGDALTRVRGWLAEARRPVMVAGLEVLSQGAESSVADFACRLNIPLVTTYKAKGILAEDHPLSLGAAGLSPRADKILLPLLTDSDLVLLAGYDPIEMRTGWRNPWPDGARVVEFSSVTNTHYMHQSAINFVGDIKSGVELLGRDCGCNNVWPDETLEQAKNQLRDLFGPGREEWGAGAVIDVARAELPRDTVATVDAGAHRILLSQKWHCYSPRTLLQSTGLCTMGCALPMAIGYKRIKPQATVAAFMGDACLEMVMGELSTLRDAALPVIVFVFVDESLSLIDLKQRGVGHDSVGVDFPGTDFVALARALGGEGSLAGSRKDLSDAVRNALARDTYTLIACQIGKHAYDGAF